MNPREGLVFAAVLLLAAAAVAAGEPAPYRAGETKQVSSWSLSPISAESGQVGSVLPGSAASERFWLTQLALRRADAREEAPSADELTVRVTDTVVTGPEVVADTSPPALPTWRPADECARVPNPGPVRLTSNTMRWCPKVAYYLDLGERLGAWTWLRGDLTRLMLLIQCESGGNPAAVNASSGTTGLYQHRPRYWAVRGAAAARLFGFTNPTISAAYDNIATGIWLFKTGGRGHWEYCGGNWGGAPAETLRGAGL